MIVTPTVMDQMDNAVRVQKMGTGTFLLNHRLTAERLVEEISLLLRKTSIHETCKQIGEEISTENGASRAAEALEKLI